MNSRGMRPLAVETASHYSVLIAYDVGNNVEYMGKADIGTISSDAKWQIKKFEYADGNLVAIKFADGNDGFDNIWDDRASISYY